MPPEDTRALLDRIFAKLDAKALEAFRSSPPAFLSVSVERSTLARRRK